MFHKDTSIAAELKPQNHRCKVALTRDHEFFGRGKQDHAQFLFHELFRDEAALKAHQESAYFKTYIAGQALPLLAKRERAQYTLL
jgi:quinol monooxygenase YgiN